MPAPEAARVHFSLAQHETKHRPAIVASVDAFCAHNYGCVPEVAASTAQLSTFVDATSYAANPEYRPVYIDPALAYMLPRVSER
jgi:hypothetical protein